MQRLNRATFVRTSAAAAGVALLGAAPRTDYGELTVQLPWIKNVEWAGEYLADKRGFYHDAGFSSVTLIGGGPGAPPVEMVITAGRAFASISSLAPTASAILAGATVKTIAVQYQTSPYIIASPAERPIRTPHDMIGKRIGVPGGNEPTWRAFLRVNGIDPARVDVVTVGSTAAPLANKQVDGLLAFVTNVPHTFEVQGIAIHWFGLGDFSYRLVNNNYIVADDTLRTKRDAVKAFLRAEIRGWKASLASPAESARITVDEYGRDLGLAMADQIAQSNVQRSLMESPQTRARGLFTLSPGDLERNVGLLRASGIDIAAGRLFDLSPLNEVYAEDPSLR
jgi:ABC-type nitrate/sulfonate/bicarbonate transport system substrate-binding protein